MVIAASDLLVFFYTHSKCTERSWMVEPPHSQNAVERWSCWLLDPFEVGSIDGDPAWVLFSFADRFLCCDGLASLFRMSAEVAVVQPQVVH